MHPLAAFAAVRGWLRGALRRGRVEREYEEEMRFHLEMETAENVRRGMNAADARRAALRAFGNADRIREQHREARGTRLVGETLTDVRHATRALRQAPGFVAVAVFTLAVAISIGTTLVSAVDGFFYRP